MTKHVPVLLDTVLAALGDICGRNVIDATFGAGGYSRAFLARGANVTAFDRDPNVAADAKALAAEYGDRFTFVPRPFSAMAELDGKYDAIIFDLGISSMQIDIPERGFSFRANGPLDMRMSADGMSAADLIAGADVSELARILRDYGDIKKATVLAHAIKDARPQTTMELKELIYNPRDVAPVFQALRIAVNDEMGEVERALGAVPNLLRAHGKCICVTFHSLEDRIVKNTFRAWTTTPGDPRMPQIASAPFASIASRVPTADELAQNPRARSAHMRGVVKSY
ncbi:16S rRNA (cytosine(1402)-N(4))-methyltransferase RsmH [bacterium]|nr:16S rRNA (cytosine(1402)-N(4))-methyltransferase RsmH [bacterium]